jgi:hypothetical protein
MPAASYGFWLLRAAETTRTYRLIRSQSGMT